MSIRNLSRGQISRPAKQSLTSAKVPAPLKGVDARVALTQGSELHCVYTYNLLPYEYGMSVRKGFREHQIDVVNADSAGVHTLIPFDGIEEQGVEDRLFAVTNEGIWDVTVSGAAPVLALAFLDTRPEAGYGNYTHYVDNDETDILMYADNYNGLFTYDEETETWAQSEDINGPVVEDIRWVVSHKQRLWMIEENSTKAWYLPIGSKKGDATEFFFGSKFKHGGNLEGLFNWTVDGGDGVDDYLVAVSRSGDVLPYRGDDPSSADTWSLVGTYFIGEVPRGPFFGTEHGGELYLLSVYGLSSMNDLLKGVDTSTLLSIDNPQGTIAGAVTGLIRNRMLASSDQYGWEVRLMPSAGAIIVAAPVIGTGAQVQYVYNLGTSGWGFWRGVPMNSFDEWKGAIVFGTSDNRVMRMDVTADNVLLTPPENRLNGNPIEFSTLTSYQSFGADALYKRAHLIRADFVADGEPEYATTARYDYDIAEAQLPTAAPVTGQSFWDDGAWDQGVWAAAGNEAFTGIQGSWGTGRYIAVAIQGKTREPTRLIGFDVLYDTGGPLQ